jgi:hypothetical protein
MIVCNGIATLYFVFVTQVNENYVTKSEDITEIYCYLCLQAYFIV